MFKKTVLRKGLIILLIAIALSILMGKSIAITAQSQDTSNDSAKKETVSFNPPTVEDNGAPAGNREGSGSHGLCQIADVEKDNTLLVAVMPKIAVNTSTKNKVYVWGETTSANPTFWFYVAYPINSQVEFILQDEAENQVYQTTFSLDETQGVIGLTLPQDKIKLETGKSYHWYLYIMCNPESSPDDFVEGWVKRVNLNPNMKNQLQSALPLEQISIYAENGLWLDTLNSIKNLQQTEPNNKAIANIWTDLLQQIGLDKISQKPIIKYYKLGDELM